MKIFSIALFIFASASCFGQELQKLYSDAMASYKAKDYKVFYNKISEANKINPTHQGILYQLGIACALNGKKAEAIENLKKAILINADFKIEGIADFNSIKDSDEFKKLVALQKEWQTPVVNSEIAFTLPDKALHTEGIEYDAQHKLFYLGSIHKRKVIKVTPDGKATDFCPSAFEGMTSIFGVKVDTRKGVLWACSSPMPEMENYDSSAKSAVYKFDLNGKLLHKYNSFKSGVYGDLILNKKGNVFISDCITNEIFTVNEKTNAIEPFYSSNEFNNIQGMTFSPDEKYLFIADYKKGIFRLDIKSHELIELKTKVDASLKGVDGIYFYENSLIAVQNGVNPLRCMRYYLDKDFNTVTKFEVIDRKHPNFNEPTLGVIDGKNFYYIANSQWSGYDDKHQIKPINQLQDIVILKYSLK